MPNEERLNPDAADKVDVVHTNMDGFGIADAMGHVDFYVNGGKVFFTLRRYAPIIIFIILPCVDLADIVLKPKTRHHDLAVVIDIKLRTKLHLSASGLLYGMNTERREC